MPDDTLDHIMKDLGSRKAGAEWLENIRLSKQAALRAEEKKMMRAMVTEVEGSDYTEMYRSHAKESKTPSVKEIWTRAEKLWAKHPANPVQRQQYIMAASGIGKSELVKKAAKDMGLPVIDEKKAPKGWGVLTETTVKIPGRGRGWNLRGRGKKPAEQIQKKKEPPVLTEREKIYREEARDLLIIVVAYFLVMIPVIIVWVMR
jgi:hypothetical protein